MSRKIAVIIFNLGGPDKLENVKPFLFNLFYDKAIINLPNPFRWFLANLISNLREDKAKKIYEKMGGKSPILENTQRQAEELEKLLNISRAEEYKVFISMRYWHPFAEETIKKIEEYNPEEVILLPLYPQFSTTTTQSSFDSFSKISDIKFKKICCYFDDKNFIKSHYNLLKESLINIKGDFRILFSAHGLPEKIIKEGDPYQWQIEQTVANIMELFSEKIDYKICYQSKVGKMKWLEPSTENEILEAAKEGKSIIIVPIAFVSDHSETLVELDLEYKELYSSISDKDYVRVDSLNIDKYYLEALKDQVFSLIDNKKKSRKCPDEFCKCLMEK